MLSTTKDTPRGGHLRLDDDRNPYAGVGAKGAFAEAAIKAREDTFKDLHEAAKEAADERDEACEPPEDQAAAVEAIAQKLKDDALGDAEARAEGEGDDPDTPWTEGGPFDPASMAANADLASNLIEDAQESADEKDGTDPIDPIPPDNTGTVTAFTAADPTEATMDGEDLSMLEVGSTITLEALTGDPDAMAAVNGQTAAVLNFTGTTATLDLDLSSANVTGLTADFVINPAAPPAPPPVASRGRPA
jgi:hypothetical protein